MDKSLKAIKEKADRIFVDWYNSGHHEADAELNDGNREVINEYLELYPNAMGYKFHEGFVDLKNSKLYNFCCNFIFNGDETAIENIKASSKDYDSVWNEIEKAEGIQLIWS